MTPEPTQEAQSWWKQWSPKLVLENKGSVARDHLANERTFLAWLRTSLSLITLGVTVAQVFRLTTPIGASFGRARDLGIAFISIGLVLLLFGLWRYFSTQSSMTRGIYPSSRGIIILSSVIITGSIIATLIVSIEQESEYGPVHTET